jgi:hypothetical protein
VFPKYDELTRYLLEHSGVPQIRTKFPYLMPSQVSLACSQQSATWTQPEPDEFSPLIPSYFFKIHFNIILRINVFVLQAVSFTFPHQKPSCTSLTHSCHMARWSHKYRFDDPKNIRYAFYIPVPRWPWSVYCACDRKGNLSFRACEHAVIFTVSLNTKVLLLPLQAPLTGPRVTRQVHAA